MFNYTTGATKKVEKGKITRLNGVMAMTTFSTTSRNKVIKDYVYSSEARIII